MQRMTRGFTLIEIMMVVAILGMVAIFAIPNYTKSINRSHERAASNNLIIIYSSQNMARNGGGSYQAGVDVGAINTNLGLGIIPGTNMTYACTVSGGDPPTAFTCNAAYGAIFTLQITNTNSTVCCSSGTCAAPAC